MQVAQNQQAKSLELCAVLSLSRFWQQQGKKQHAVKFLQQNYDCFSEGFDSHDLQAAASLIRDLDV